MRLHTCHGGLGVLWYRMWGTLEMEECFCRAVPCRSKAPTSVTTYWPSCPWSLTLPQAVRSLTHHSLSVSQFLLLKQQHLKITREYGVWCSVLGNLLLVFSSIFLSRKKKSYCTLYFLVLSCNFLFS